MPNQVLTPPNQSESSFRQTREPELNLLMGREEPSLWRSIYQQAHDRLFPEKLPPLQLTSRPVKVKDIWGEYNYTKKSAVGSTVVHAIVIGAIIGLTIMGRHVVKKVEEQHVMLVAPDLSEIMPISTKKNDTISGGGSRFLQQA